MSIITSQQISRFYDSFHDMDVIFNGNVIDATGLQRKYVYLKCLGYQWPCIVYSTSMVGAKLIINLKPSGFGKIKQAKNNVSLRFAFKLSDRNDLLTFFIASRVTGFSPYNSENRDVHFVTVAYSQRPPDDFIEILGQLLEANANAEKRREDRIIITNDSIRKLGLKSADAYAQIEGVPRRCILRDLSFSGAKILVLGVAKYLLEKRVVLKMQFADQDEALEIDGIVTRHESVEGRRDITALGVQFDEENVPIAYKLRINDFFRKSRILTSSTD